MSEEQAKWPTNILIGAINKQQDWNYRYNPTQQNYTFKIQKEYRLYHIAEGKMMFVLEDTYVMTSNVHIQCVILKT